MKSKKEVKEFSTLTPEIYSLREYLQEQEVTKVAMESSGIYWIPIWNILEAPGIELMLIRAY